MDSLPADCIRYIFTFADAGMQDVGRMVCRRWRAALPPCRSSLENFVKYPRLTEWAISQGCPIDDSTEQIAACWFGNLAYLQRLHQKGIRILQVCTMLAAQNGYRGLLEWLVSIGVPLHARTEPAAVQHGDVQLLAWLYEQGCERDSLSPIAAIEKQDLQLMEVLYDHGHTFLEAVVERAVALGNIETLEWLREHGGEFGWKAIYSAIHEGNLDVLAWLYEKEYRREYRIGLPISRSKRPFEVLQWFHDNTSLLSYEKLYDIISHGNIALLPWFRDNGYLSNDALPCIAASLGRLDLLQWLVENGSRLSKDVYRAASANDRRDVVEWLEEQSIHLHLRKSAIN